MPNESGDDKYGDARQRFFDRIAAGSIALDGIMSPLTRTLMERFATRNVDMTFGWACTPMDWACPACGRPKPDIVRVNSKGDLMCRLVEHHDHMKDMVRAEFERQCKNQERIVADEYAKRFASRAAPMVSAYDNTIICDDCNAADPMAKNVVGTHKDFSYSPQEIRRFVRPRPNLPHTIDIAEAASIWQGHEQTFALRLKIIERIANIAATNTHWYQELPYPHRAESVKAHAEFLQSHYGAPGAIYELSGGRQPPPPANKSAWRYVVHKAPRHWPRSEDVEYVAKVTFAKDWKKVDEHWRCPTCDRTKHDTVRKSNKGDWTFVLSDRSFYAPGERYRSKRAILCGDCGLLASSLGKEACVTAGAETVSNYAQFLLVSEIAQVVRPQRNGRHNVKNEEANALVARLVERITSLECSTSEPG
jgi:rubredoxin